LALFRKKGQVSGLCFGYCFVKYLLNKYSINLSTGQRNLEKTKNTMFVVWDVKALNISGKKKLWKLFIR
jgi:hypothetical protein